MARARVKGRGEKRIDFEEFLDAIGHFAEKVGVPPDAMADKMLKNGENPDAQKFALSGHEVAESCMNAGFAVVVLLKML